MPYPLSGLHDVPIVHTTLLSSYFDYPCGKVCQNKSQPLINKGSTTNNSPSLSSLLINSVHKGQSKYIDSTVSKSDSGLNVTSNKNQPSDYLSNVTKEIYDNQLLPGSSVYESSDGKKMVIDLSQSNRQQKDLIDESDGSASGSGESPVLPSITDNIHVVSSKVTPSTSSLATTLKPKVTINVLTSIDSNESLKTSSVSPSLPGHSVASVEPFGVRSVWKIWQFFVGGTGHESGSVVISAANETSNSKFSSNQSITSNLSSLRKRPSMYNNSYNSNQNITNNSSSINVTNEVWLMNGKRCNGFDKSVCVDISVSKLLRARLCCLNEVTGGLMGPGKGFRCTGYTKSICNKMFPLIKCCLKDFHHILGKYLNNNSSHSLSSNIG